MPRRISKKQVKQEIYFKPVRKSTSTVADCQPALTITGPDLPIKYLYTGNGIRDNCKIIYNYLLVVCYFNLTL